jgi:hypothetical protein
MFGIDDILGAVTGVVGDIAGSAFGNMMQGQNQKEAEKFNAGQAELNRNFQSQQFQKQMDFNSAQAVLSRGFVDRERSTQYQTAVGDMKRAGLNPMLAYSQGGAGNVSGSAASVGSGGSGSSASISPAAVHGIGNVTQSASELVSNMKDIENKDKQGRLLDAQAQNTAADTLLKGAQTDSQTASASQLYASRDELQAKVMYMMHQVDNLDQQTEESRSRQALNITDNDLAWAKKLLTDMETKLKSKEVDLTGVNVGLAQIEKVLRGNEVPKSELFKNLWSVPQGVTSPSSAHSSFKFGDKIGTFFDRAFQ